jgi:prevent-host-death family protein
MNKMVGTAEFKAHCSRIMAEAERTGETVVITKRGKPIMELKPIKRRERRSIIGALKGSVLKYERPFDPACEPEEWNAVRGDLGDIGTDRL